MLTYTYTYAYAYTYAYVHTYAYAYAYIASENQALSKKFVPRGLNHV